VKGTAHSHARKDEGEPLRPAVTVFPGALDASAPMASRLRAVHFDSLDWGVYYSSRR